MFNLVQTVGQWKYDLQQRKCDCSGHTLSQLLACAVCLLVFQTVHPSRSLCLLIFNEMFCVSRMFLKKTWECSISSACSCHLIWHVLQFTVEVHAVFQFRLFCQLVFVTKSEGLDAVVYFQLLHQAFFFASACFGCGRSHLQVGSVT